MVGGDAVRVQAAILGEEPFNGGWVEPQGVVGDVEEDRVCARVPDGVGGRRQGRGQYQVAGLHTGDHERGLEALVPLTQAGVGRAGDARES